MGLGFVHVRKVHAAQFIAVAFVLVPVKLCAGGFLPSVGSAGEQGQQCGQGNDRNCPLPQNFRPVRPGQLVQELGRQENADIGAQGAEQTVQENGGENPGAVLPDFLPGPQMNRRGFLPGNGITFHPGHPLPDSTVPGPGTAWRIPRPAPAAAGGFPLPQSPRPAGTGFDRRTG